MARNTQTELALNCARLELEAKDALARLVNCQLALNDAVKLIEFLMSGKPWTGEHRKQAGEIRAVYEKGGAP